jgi:HTH-type transcriptional regulator / antitoxin HipB
MFIRTASDLGALIRERRLKLGLDQITVARKAGTSRKWLIEVESGKPRAEIGLILRTLKALGVTLAATDTTSGAPSGSTKKTAPSVDINQVIDSLKMRR